MRDSHARRQQNPPHFEGAEIIVALILMVLFWFAWYVARERFYLQNRQIAEIACYLALAGLSIGGPVILVAAGERVVPHGDIGA